MTQSQLFDAIRELLPFISREAVSAWEDFIADMNIGNPQGELRMCGELYAEILLIQQDYNDEVATALFNMGARHTVNTFELPGAAEMMEGGMDEEEIFREITGSGWHPSEEHTQRVKLIVRNLG